MALRPLARALLASGLSYREFAEVAKSAFVGVAASEYGIRGRRTNNSRIAVITGISRKEVRRVLDRSDITADDDLGESPSSVVLHNWHNDPEYLDSSGVPRPLPYSGGNNSFDSLVRKCVGDIPVGAMRKELIRVGAVEDNGNSLKAIKPYFVPPGLNDRLIIGLEEGAATLLSTIAHNSNPAREEAPRFQRIASVDGIAEKFFPEIEAYSHQKLTEIGLNFCTYLDEFERRSSPAEKDTSRQVGIGLYYYNVDLG